MIKIEKNSTVETRVHKTVKKSCPFSDSFKNKQTSKSRMFTIASILYVFLLVLSIIINPINGKEGYSMGEPKIKNGELAVMFSQLPFDENQWMGKLKRETYSMENVTGAIAASNTGIDYAMISHAAELLQREMLNLLKAGKSVDVLGLGHLYIQPKAKVKGDLPLPEDVTHFVPKFTASKLLRDEVSALKVSTTTSTDSGPVIKQVTSLADGNTEGLIKAGRNVRLTGSRLAVGGEGAGIYFVPEKDGQKDDSSSNWVSCDISYLPKNTSKYVEFTAPTTLKAGSKYWILLRSKICSNGKERKTQVEAYSAQITVSA